MKVAYIVGDVIIVLGILSFIPFWKKDGNFVNLWSAIKPTDNTVINIVPVVRGGVKQNANNTFTPKQQYPMPDGGTCESQYGSGFIPNPIGNGTCLPPCPANKVRVRGGACVSVETALFH